MARVKRSVVARSKHKKVLKQAKGYYGARRKVFRVAKQAVTKAGQYAYRVAAGVHPGTTGNGLDR